MERSLLYLRHFKLHSSSSVQRAVDSLLHLGYGVKMKPFCLLEDPSTYVALDWDLAQDSTARTAWFDLFETVFEEILHHALDVYGKEAHSKIEAARRDFKSNLNALRANPRSFAGAQLNLMALDRIRDTTLRSHGLPDPFLHIKHRENHVAITIYPKIVEALQARSGRDKWLHLIEGVIAGNTFDLGATATLHLGRESQDFLVCIKNTKPRPWLEDDFDTLANILLSSEELPWQKAIVFVDNAGSDFVLGVMPLVRELALNNVKIILAANSLPSLNDITADEVHHIVKQLATKDPELDELLSQKSIQVVATGTDLPVIDLSAVSDELNAASADTDLIVLEGMGRGIETNYNANFKVDTLRICLIKNESVAHRIGGTLFDCICRFEPARLPTTTSK
jgi:type II pantothenate kinase